MAFASNASDLRWQIPVTLVLGGVLAILGQRMLRRAGWLSPPPFPGQSQAAKTHGDPAAPHAANTSDAQTTMAVTAEPASRRRPHAPTKTKTAKRKRKTDDANA